MAKLIIPDTEDGLRLIVNRYNAIHKTDLTVASNAMTEAVLNKTVKDREDILMQLVIDLALLSLHDEFGMAEKRLVRFRDAFQKRWSWMMDIVKSDLDSEIKTTDPVQGLAVTSKKIDDALKAILGEHFETWEERYES